jgi:capsular polysaccharide biosynthesis protein/Mrp family chromosome partitioning ATPase
MNDQFPVFSAQPDRVHQRAGFSASFLSFHEFLHFLSEAKWVVLICVLLSLIAASLFISMLPRLYTAQTSLLVDSNKGQLSRSRDDASNFGVELAEIETQLQILKSQKIALVVVDRLGLDRDPLFMGEAADSSLTSRFKSLFPKFSQASTVSESGPDGRYRAAMRLADALSVARVGASYVVSVTVNASDPARAAQIANALTEVYITDRVEARLESAQRTNIEQERQRELRLRVLSSAVPPVSASSPRRRIILAVATVFGAFFGLGMAFLRRAMDDTVRLPEQIASTGARLLAAVPATRFGRRNSRDGARAPPGFDYARLNPLSLFAQSVKKIGLAVQVANPRPGPGFCLGILSVTPGEGASTVAHNLADALGTSGRRTLLVEIDLRNADRKHPKHNDSALNYSFLSGTKLCATLSPNKGRRPGGDAPAGLEQLLASEEMEKFLSQCRRDYACVLVDCPAAELLSDATVMTRRLDALVVVVEWGRLPFDLYAASMPGLDGGSCKVLGVVLNKCQGLPVRFTNRLKRRSGAEQRLEKA